MKLGLPLKMLVQGMSDWNVNCGGGTFGQYREVEPLAICLPCFEQASSSPDSFRSMRSTSVHTPGRRISFLTR